MNGRTKSFELWKRKWNEDVTITSVISIKKKKHQQQLQIKLENKLSGVSNNNNNNNNNDDDDSNNNNNNNNNSNSWTSRKPPPKMSSLGGRLREVVAYESLDHIW